METTSSGSLLLSSGVKGLQGDCYGCASAAIEHCVTLLRALAMVPETRKQLVEEVGLIIMYCGAFYSFLGGKPMDQRKLFHWELL